MKKIIMMNYNCVEELAQTKIHEVDYLAKR